MDSQVTKELHQPKPKGALTACEKVAVIFSILAIALMIFFQRETLPFLDFDYLRSIHFANAFAIVLTFVLLLFGRKIYKEKIALRQEILSAWPFFLFYTLAFIVLIIAFFNSGSAYAEVDLPLRWYFQRGVLYLSLLAAYLLGTLSRRASATMFPYAFAALAGIALISGLAELAANMGFDNFVHQAIQYWKTNLSTRPNSMWQWDGVESMRIAGYSSNPNFFGYIAALSFLWALAASALKLKLRSFIGISSFMVVLMSGSRGALIIVTVCILIFALLNSKRILNKVKEKMPAQKNKRVFLGLTAALSVVGAVALLSVSLGGLNRLVLALLGSPQAMVNALFTGREVLWLDALATIYQHPFGSGLLDAQLVGRNFHNMFLSAWASGGPVLFISLIVLLWWIIFKAITKEQRLLAYFLGAFLIVLGTFDHAFPGGTVLPLALFILGSASAIPKTKEIEELDTQDEVQVATCAKPIVQLSAMLKKFFHTVKEFTRDSWNSRAITWQLSFQKIVKEYKGTGLGVVWAVLQPLVFVFIFWFAIEVGLRGGRDVGEEFPFFFWLIPGIFAWRVITVAIGSGGNSIRENANLVTKVVFPKITIPQFVILSLFIVHVVVMLFAMAIFIAFGYPPTIYWLQLVYAVAVNFIFCLIVAVLLSAITAFSKDFLQFVRMIMTGLFWFSGIIWPLSNLDGLLAIAIKLNPIAYVVETYRWSMIYHTWFWEHPTWSAYFWGLMLVHAIIAIVIWGRTSRHFADVL